MPQCCRYGMMGAMGWWWLIGLLVVVLLIAGIVALALRSSGPRATAPLDEPREVLRARFARGEISREEYEERDALLSGRAKDRAR